MGTALFFLGFLAVGVVGVEALGSLESLPSERIGATGFLLLLCIGAGVFSTLSFAESARGFVHRPRWFEGLLGGVFAAATFCGTASVAWWLGRNVGYVLLTLAFALPSVTAWWWAFLSAKSSARRSSN